MSSNGSSDTQTFDIRMDSLLNVFSGLQNPYTGMGNPYVDPTQHTYIQPGLSRISRQEQSALVRQSGLLKKLITNLPKAATWRWGRPTLANGDAKVLQAIADAINSIPVETPLQRLGKTRKGYQVAGELALQTGNSALILDVDDGRRLDEPLDRKNIKKINKLALLSRHTLRPDITTLNSGLFEHFVVLSAYNMRGYVSGQRIHRSRVHWFRGVPILDDYDLIANQGCDDSILELVRDAYLLYQPAVQAAGRMLTDFDVPVRQVKDLAQNIADRGDEYAAELRARLQVDQMSRSNYRTQVIDMDMEGLDNWTRQVSGMSDLFDRVKENLLASIDIPPAVAFGEFASGLNSTGQSTTEKQLWNESAAQFQVDKYDDSILDLQQVVCLCKTGPTGGQVPDGLGWEWLSPYPPSPEEQAALELQRAQLIQDLNGVDPRFGKVAIAATYGHKQYSSNITLPKVYADALQRDIKEESKPQPTEPDVSALEGQPDDEAPTDEAEPPEDEQELDQSIADDILSDRTLLDSADVRTDAATRKELMAKAKVKNEGLPKGKKFVVFGKTNAAIAEFVGEGMGEPVKPKAAAKPKGGTKGGKYQTSKTSSAIAEAIARKTGANPEAIEKDLRGKIQKAIDQKRKDLKKEGKTATEADLRQAAKAVVKVEAKQAIAVARGEVKATEPAAKTPKSTEKAKPKSEKPAVTGKPEEAGTSLRDRAKATKANVSKPDAPQDDEAVLKKNGHNNFAVKERIRELQKLRPDDAGDKVYRKALLDPIDPSGSTESSLDRTLDQRRLREKVVNGKALSEDDVRDAGANLRQGMRGAAGGNNNYAQLEYSAQIYDRLNDKQKNGFAAEAGKAIHDDPLHKESRYAAMIGDIKTRHQKIEDIKDGKLPDPTDNKAQPLKESDNGSRVSQGTNGTGSKGGSSASSDKKATEGGAKPKATATKEPVKADNEISDRAEFNAQLKAWSPGIKSVGRSVDKLNGQEDLKKVSQQIESIKTASADSKHRVYNTDVFPPRMESLPKDKALQLLEKQRKTTQKDVAKAEKGGVREPSVNVERLAAAATIYEDMQDSLKDKRNKAGGIKDADGKMAAAYTYRPEGDHLYLDYLVTSPENLFKDGKGTKGAGTQAVANIIQKSIDAGKDGKIRLMALEDAMPFYKKIGFEHEGEEGNEYMTLSPQAAKAFLQKVGGSTPAKKNAN